MMKEVTEKMLKDIARNVGVPLRHLTADPYTAEHVMPPLHPNARCSFEYEWNK